MSHDMLYKYLRIEGEHCNCRFGYQYDDNEHTSEVKSFIHLVNCEAPLLVLQRLAIDAVENCLYGWCYSSPNVLKYVIQHCEYDLTKSPFESHITAAMKTNMYNRNSAIDYFVSTIVNMSDDEHVRRLIKCFSDIEDLEYALRNWSCFVDMSAERREKFLKRE